LVGGPQADQHGDQLGLPIAINSSDAYHFAWFEVERNIAQRRPAAVVLHPDIF
jgi:hypothetical protein